MDSFRFSLRNPWILYFLIPIFTFTFGNFTMFIITSLILGSFAFLFLAHSNHKVKVLEQEELTHYQEYDDTDLMNSDQNDSNAEVEGFLTVGSSDSVCESEIIDPYSCTTDGSISDEESLIEIELCGGHYVEDNNYEDEGVQKFGRRKMSPESVLWWLEMNEEENMIEIDISMGSIKCSRFQVKA